MVLFNLWKWKMKYRLVINAGDSNNFNEWLNAAVFIYFTDSRSQHKFLEQEKKNANCFEIETQIKFERTCRDKSSAVNTALQRNFVYLRPAQSVLFHRKFFFSQRMLMLVTFIAMSNNESWIRFE